MNERQRLGRKAEAGVVEGNSGDPGPKNGESRPEASERRQRSREAGSTEGNLGLGAGDAERREDDFGSRSGDPEPGGGDGGDTRQRLLQAARKILAEKGFDGTSVRAVTEAAGANLGAVTYHFESKEKLYHAVLEEVLGPMREQAQLLKGLPFSPLQRLEFFIRGMFQHLSENPDMPRFMVQEIVLGSEPAPPILETVRVVAPVLVGIIQEGQHVGTVREGDPVLMALSALSQPIYLSIMPPVLGREDLKTAGVPQPRISPEDHAVEFVLRGLAVRQEESE